MQFVRVPPMFNSGTRTPARAQATQRLTRSPLRIDRQTAPGSSPGRNRQR